MFEKMSVKNIVEFRRRSEKSRVTFINSLKKARVDASPENGGDYWIISSSTIGRLFKNNEKDLIHERINEIVERRDKTNVKVSRDMYSRNIAILNGFDGFDFSKYKPGEELTYLPKPKDKSVLKMKGVPVQIQPSYVFSFKENEVDKIGAMWFITRLNGFDVKEIAMFSDALFRYLKRNYKRLEVDPEYCGTMDLGSQQYVNYRQIETQKIKSELDSILVKIKRML